MAMQPGTRASLGLFATVLYDDIRDSHEDLATSAPTSPSQIVLVMANPRHLHHPTKIKTTKAVLQSQATTSRIMVDLTARLNTQELTAELTLARKLIQDQTN